MRSVKMLADIRDVSRAAGDRWYVTNGITAVGPVNFDLLTRGIEAGKVPMESFVRHEAWTVWRPLAEIAVVTGDATPRGDGAAASDVASDDITAPHYPALLFEPPPDTQGGEYLNVPLDELFGSTDEINDTSPQSRPPLEMSDAPRPSDDAITTPRRLITPHPPVFAEGLFNGCATLDDALKVLVEAAVQGAGPAPLGILVHQVRGENAFVVRAYGPRKDEALGARTPLSDPAMQAAAGGVCVVAEPCPGPAGRAIEARLERLGVVASGAAMIPIRVAGAGPARWPGRLFGSIELGRSTQLLPVEVAAIGELAEKFAKFIMRSGWA